MLDILSYLMGGKIESELVTQTITDWLDENVAQETGYVIDKSLTVEDAAADAKKTGQEITNLKSAVSDNNNILYENGSERSVDATADGWKLVSETGLCVQASSYELLKYKVESGSKIKITTNGLFQFQSSASVPSTGTSNRIGKTYDGANDMVFTVPQSATYLIVSTETASSISNVYDVTSDLRDDITAIDGALGYDLLEPDSAPNNYALLSNGFGYYNQQYKLVKYQVNPGDTVYVNSPKPASGYASFQFQSAAGVSELNNDNLVGEPYVEKVQGNIVVPTGAYYIIFSMLKSDTVSGLYGLEKIEEIEAQLLQKPNVEDVQSKMFVSAYNTLDGWESHAKAFATLMEDVSDTEGFLFFTDTHFMAKQTESDWKAYAYPIFAYIEQLYYASPCSFVLHGGDWLGTGDTRANALYKMSVINGVFRSRFDRYALLVGNHETGNQMQGNNVLTKGTLAATLLANIGTTYYKFDANTFRMYCFDSWESAALDSYGKSQVAWFADSLENETAEHIVIAIHILLDSGNLMPMGDELTKCAAAYNARTTYTYNGTTYDFSSATGKVAFVIAGHRHLDDAGTVNGIPYILTTNTTEYSDTTFNNLPLPIDLMKVDWTSKKLTAYRAARGQTGTTREITIL